MLERKREVVAEHSTYYVCDVHGWDFTGVDEDVCPVCFGESLEHERIMDKLEFYSNQLGTYDTARSKNFKVAIDTAILFIKGKNNG
jgi:hypothetical protein